jgi:hypothetical protein
MKLCECGCGQPAPIAKRSSTLHGQVKGQTLRFVQGHATRGKHINRTHGLTDSPEYRSFAAAKSRCTNPNRNNWERYGGRGIEFRFTSFEEFFAHIGPRPEGMTLDRYPNNDGNYEPGNVRWATLSEQCKNQRPVSDKTKANMSAAAKRRYGKSSHLTEIVEVAA